jgi:hypothetical protein
MITQLEVVDRCLLLYSKPGRWTQKVNARDRDGKPVPIFSEEARSFDLEGALKRAAGKDYPTFYANMVKIRRITEDEKGKQKVETIPGPLHFLLGGQNCFDWNDEKGRTQEEVVAFLRDLKSFLEERQS